MVYTIVFEKKYEKKHETKKNALKYVKKYCTIITVCEFSRQCLHDWRK